MSRPQKARLPLSLLHLAAVLEGRRPWRILDGNVLDDLENATLQALANGSYGFVGVTVMPGPQVAPAIRISKTIRASHPAIPIAWGGYFPTLYPDAAINAPYLDYVVRGQGEETLLGLLACLDGSADGPAGPGDVRGLTWKRGGVPVHNPDRPVIPPTQLPPLPYEKLGDVERFLPPSFMGRRTAVHQHAIGCRYRCKFCGVVSMWDGTTELDGPKRLLETGRELRDRWGADALQFYDHNFFDTEESSRPILDVLETLGMPWWCYARADTLANFSTSTWEKIRRSGLRMAYIGAEAGSDASLRRMQKGTKVQHTLEVAARTREYGVIPEFSFVLGGPEEPEGELEKTFQFIRRLKEIHPESEIILYIYSPTPQRRPGSRREPPGPDRLPVLEQYGPSGPELPTTPEEWTEPRWVDWVCHRDAPWLTPRLRRRIREFRRVLSCRFPTVQDYGTPEWGKTLLRNLARWRWATETYERPWELELARRVIPLREPREESL